MAQETALQIVLASRPKGKVTPEDFRVEEFTPSLPGPAEILVKADYLSLDPYMRGRMDDKKSYAEPVKIGEVMPGESVSTVVASRHESFTAQGEAQSRRRHAALRNSWLVPGRA